MIAGLKFTFIHRTLSNTRQRRAAAASRVTRTPPSSDPSKSTAITVVRGIFPNNYRISVLKYSLELGPVGYHSRAVKVASHSGPESQATVEITGHRPHSSRVGPSELAHAVSRHIAPLRDRRSPVAATPKKNQISKPNSSNTRKVSSTLPVPAIAAAAPRTRSAAAARAPAIPANSISRRIRQGSGNRCHQLGAAALGYHSPGSNPPANSIGGRNPHTSHYPALPHATSSTSKRPARSRRRPFGVPSPCRKNEQENCRFTWDWQPRRPPASRQQQVRSLASPRPALR